MTLYGVSDEVAKQLPMGQTLTIELQSDKVKDGTDPTKPWNHFWSFVRLAQASEAAPPPPAQSTVQPPVYPVSELRRERSIQRQVALKASIDYCKDVEPAQIVITAQRFYDWLAEGST